MPNLSDAVLLPLPLPRPLFGLEPPRPFPLPPFCLLEEEEELPSLSTTRLVGTPASATGVVR
jgi:hypothetical protein